MGQTRLSHGSHMQAFFQRPVGRPENIGAGGRNGCCAAERRKGRWRNAEGNTGDRSRRKDGSLLAEGGKNCWRQQARGGEAVRELAESW